VTRIASASVLKEWQQNPCLFVQKNFGVDPDPWQEETLMKCAGIRPRRRLGMKACTGPGKSAVLAWIGWHRLTCYGERGEHPKGAALSGEGRDNLRDNLWAELSKWQGRSEYLQAAFTWTKSQIYANDHAETWFLSARSYPKEADEESIGTSISGLHSKYPFLLLDEIGKMPVGVGKKAEQIFTGSVKDGMIAAAGNPTSTTGLLYEVCTALRELWEIITITADPDDPKRTTRVDIENAREMIRLYGRDDPWVMATILGLFPKTGFNNLLSVDQVEEAMNRHITSDKYQFAQKRIGVDVARFGDDNTILFPRQGLLAHLYVVMRNARSDEIAARTLLGKKKWGSEIEFVDGTGGFGAGVVDSMRLAGQEPQEVNFSGRASNDRRYYNKRAEMWFEMAEWVKRGGVLPKKKELVKQLTAPTYTLKDGRLLIEPKELIKKRLGFSPDAADALALTFALPDMPGSFGTELGQVNRNTTLHEYDPYSDERINA
jgi:phage terminase large subunit